MVADFILESGGFLVELPSFLLRDEELSNFDLEGAFWGFGLILTVALLVSVVAIYNNTTIRLISAKFNLLISSSS